MNITKEESRQRWIELRTLVIDWDPLALISGGAPQDEYDCLVPEIFQHLQSSTDPQQLTDYLNIHISNHFGLAPNREETKLFVQKVFAWYKTKWSGSNV